MQIMCTTHSQIRPGKWGKGKREWTPGRVKWKTDHDETGATVELRSACVRVCNLWSKVCWFLKRMPIQNLIGLNKETEAFEPWCWRRLLRVPWTARRSNQSIKKNKINPGDSLEGLWIASSRFIGGTTSPEAEAPILWPPDAKSWLIWKDPDAGQDWRQEEKGMTEDEMVGWHHRLNGHQFE